MLFSRTSITFALKLYTAAMLAFYIAAFTGLAQPYWAMVTCCVLMNPIYGATRAKAIYRLVGTILAAITAITLASLFASEQIFMLGFSGLLASLAAGCAVIDRTPRSYICQLYAITLMLIIIPFIGSPLSMFTFTITRLCEICLGIACCTFVDGLFSPGSLRTRVSSQIQGWVNDMQQWMDDLINLESSSKNRAFERIRAITDMASLSILADQIRYDPKLSNLDKQLIYFLQNKFIGMLQGFHILEQGRQALTHHAALEQSDGSSLIKDSYEKTAHSMAADLGKLKQLAEQISTPDNIRKATKKKIRKSTPLSLIPDLAIAGEVTLASLLTFTLLSFFWYFTAWQQGPIIVLLGVIPIVFFGATDFADIAIEKFNLFVILSMVIAGTLCYFLMPLAFNVVWFMVLCALVIIPLGAWSVTNPMAILLLAFIFSNINLQNTYAPYTINSFVEQTIGCMIGVAVGYTSLRLVRRLGAAHALKRAILSFRKDTSNQLRQIKKGNLKTDISTLVGGLTHIAPRLAATQQQELSERLLTHISIVEQAQHIAALAKSAPLAVQQHIAILFERLSENALEPVDESYLREQVDLSMNAIWSDETYPLRHSLLNALLNLRLCLFPDQPAWESSK